MSGIPILTLLTLLPVAGAAVALFSGKHARSVALVTTLIGLALALLVWTQLPADGSIGLTEHGAWAPSIGIEYVLGVDGLGALMLVLSALVTLMSVDAAHRVHRQPHLYFALVLLLEAGLFGSFTALNFFHWFLFWELSLLPAFFLIKLWGGAKRGPASTQFFVYTMAGSVALLVAFLAVFLSTGSMDFGHLTALASTGELEQTDNCASRPGNSMARSGRTRRIRCEGAAVSIPHMAPRRILGGPFAGNYATNWRNV